jgi:hypothetical protein
VNGRRRDQRGIALSSPLALLAAGAVVVAGAAFVVTGGGNEADTPRATQAAAPTRSTPTASAAPTTAAPTPVRKAAKKKPKKKAKRPVVQRGDTYVEVYNNSGISGLAGSTASRAQGAGWQVVGSDNWYGTIPASTVYYPPRLYAQAQMLGKDLGIARLKPAIAPMRGDRLTVILTSDYS